MTTSPVNFLERAKQGDILAINELMNHLLQSKGITATVTLQDEYLNIILLSEQVPEQEQSIAYVHTILSQLNLAHLKGAKLQATYGFAGTETFKTWKQELSLTESSPRNNSTDTTNFQDQLASKMMGLFETVVEERKKYYLTHPEKVPTQHNVQSIISGCANKNSMISGGLNIIPGPLGMVAAIPEILLVIRNQIVMIYDLGIAYGKGKFLNKELLAIVFAYALGRGGLGLLVVYGSQVLIKQISLRIFPKVVQIIAGQIIQRFIRSMVGKWLPIVGAAAMATWSNYSTREIGRKAVEIFEKSIEYSSDIADTLQVTETD